MTFRTVPGQPPAVGGGSPPSFRQLAKNDKYITESDASAFPPLANDFLHADSNRNGKITKSEYERWVNKDK